MPAEKDNVQRRVVVEYGRHYAYVYMSDGRGKVLDDESFKQPFALAQREVAEEARDAFDYLYQHLQDTVLWPSTARDEEDEGNSEEED